jgi:hypothetical protein
MLAPRAIAASTRRLTAAGNDVAVLSTLAIDAIRAWRSRTSPPHREQLAAC